MRWKQANATAVVALRVQRINSEWQSTAASHPIIDGTSFFVRIFQPLDMCYTESLTAVPVSYQSRSYSSKEEDMAEDTFLDWLQQQSPGMLAPQDVAQFIQQAAAALQGIHEQRMVHG